MIFVVPEKLTTLNFEENVTLGLESNFPDEYGTKQGQMGPLSNSRVKIQIYVYSLTFEINNFAFEVKVY